MLKTWETMHALYNHKTKKCIFCLFFTVPGLYSHEVLMQNTTWRCLVVPAHGLCFPLSWVKLQQIPKQNVIKHIAFEPCLCNSLPASLNIKLQPGANQSNPIRTLLMEGMFGYQTKLTRYSKEPFIRWTLNISIFSQICRTCYQIDKNNLPVITTTDISHCTTLHKHFSLELSS